MTRYKKDNNGNYIIRGQKFEMLEGSRAQVIHGTAYKTSGELTKKDLLQNKNGRIVSRKKHVLAKKEKRLVHAGYGTRNYLLVVLIQAVRRAHAHDEADDIACAAAQ